MLIERECRAEAVLPHHLEAEGVGQTHALISESPEPAIDRRALELAIDRTCSQRMYGSTPGG